MRLRLAPLAMVCLVAPLTWGCKKDDGNKGRRLGEPCTLNADCGGPDDLCVELEGLARCGRGCSSSADCPAEHSCVPAAGLPGSPLQCLPDSGAWECNPALCYPAGNACANAPGAGFPEVGQSCPVGFGPCETTGSWGCSDDRASVVCDGTPLDNASDETCDGQDNDCDGAADEGPGGLPLQEPCYTGDPATRGVGICTPGRWTCTNGVFGACVGEASPLAEVCNGFDDDCDGEADEGCELWEGSGKDGILDISSAFNINSDLDASGMVPAPAYPVAGFTGDRILRLDVAPDGIAPGDEVLVINLRGTGHATGFAHVGSYETGFVATVSATAIQLRQPLQQQYADAGVLAGDQAIMVQRVPHFESVNVGAGGILTANAFNGVTGGVLFFRSRTTVTVDAAGTITMAGAGLRGSSPAGNGLSGNPGEGHRGAPWDNALLQDPSANGSGGGGGASDCTTLNCSAQTIGAAGGGGGHGTAGTAGAANGASHTGGAAGAMVGDVGLTALFLGGGGGGGAGGTSGQATSTPGGNGGGIIIVAAAEISVQGVVSAAGEIGSFNNNCALAAGGGGGGSGAGGTIHLAAPLLTIGSGLVRAAGAAAQCHGGGAGGDGRVRLDFATLNGAQFGVGQADTEAANGCDPDPGFTGGL